MSDRADALRAQLIRNFDDIAKEREQRPPLYDTLCARLAAGTAARGLGMAIAIVAPVAFLPPGPEYPHQIVNTSNPPLKYLSIGTMARPEIVEYPDSDKLYVSAGPPGPPVLGRVLPRALDLDYWEGEP